MLERHCREQFDTVSGSLDYISNETKQGLTDMSVMSKHY
jgi:hypothetical protein